MAAVLAGQTPKTTPTSKLKPRASTTVSSFIAKTQSPRIAKKKAAISRELPVS
ncbi:MAG: hypothetical protein K9G10_02720 [Rhodoluna sp.]|nr:hypothetical protein [Rhodoluna sp.]